MDADDNIEESNEENNISSRQISYHVQKPDLTIISTSSKLSVTGGESIAVSCEILNSGDAVANFSIINYEGLKYYLSEDAVFDSNDTYLGKTNINDFTVGESRTITDNISMPIGKTDGNYYILFYVDPTNDVAESNERNNVGAKSLDLFFDAVSF